VKELSSGEMLRFWYIWYTTLNTGEANSTEGSQLNPCKKNGYWQQNTVLFYFIPRTISLQNV